MQRGGSERALTDLRPTGLRRVLNTEQEEQSEKQQADSEMQFTAHPGCVITQNRQQDLPQRMITVPGRYG